MVRKFGGERIECHVCKQRVYPLEACKFDSYTYHKSCMRCTHCDGKVGLKGLAMIGDKIYCKPHFKELFKQTGGSYDAFDDILSQKASTETIGTIESETTQSKDKESPKEQEEKQPPMSPTKSSSNNPKPTVVPPVMKSPKPSSTTANVTKSPGRLTKSAPGSLKKKKVGSSSSPTARETSVEVPLWSPTPKKPCISPLTGEQIIPPSEDRTDESEFALTLKEIKEKPHKRPSLINLDVPKHENQNEFDSTLKSIKTKDATKKLKKKGKKKKSSLATITESEATEFWLVIEKGNLDSLKSALKEMNNLKVLFIKNDDGQTPIEYVFSNKKQSSDSNSSNSEFIDCGRYMMDYLQSNI